MEHRYGPGRTVAGWAGSLVLALAMWYALLWVVLRLIGEV